MPKLLSGESMVLPPIKKHWIVLVRWMLWPALAGLIVFVLFDVILLSVPLGDLRLWLTLLDLALLFAFGYGTWLNWESSMLTVTDQRVILEQGIFVRTTKVIPLDRVQDVSTTQKLIGRLLDYGSVEIDTAGAIPNELFTYAAHPEMLRDQVFVLSEQLRRGISGPTPQYVPLYGEP